MIFQKEKSRNFSYKEGVFFKWMLESENQNKKQNQAPLDKVILSWKDLKKKEPSRLKTNFKKYKLILSLKIKKISTFARDYWHLLIKSAAQNHLRIQECKKPQAGESCNLEFGSFSELKRYQKKVRLFTYSFSSTLISVAVALIVAQVFFGFGKTQSATFGWLQARWDGAESTSANANHDSYKTGWTGVYFKDGDIDVTNLEAKITAVPGSAVDTTDANFNTAQTKTNVYVDATGGGAFSLLKTDGMACSTNSQCKNAWCDVNVCKNAWQSAPTSAVGTNCQALLNPIKVYRFDANNNSVAQWKTTNDACNTPQCDSVLVADNTVDFSLYPARQACKDIGGRLPNINELDCIYSNNASFGTFHMGQIYWSSSKVDPTSARYMTFSSGGRNFTNKTSSFYVRCVKD